MLAASARVVARQRRAVAAAAAACSSFHAAAPSSSSSSAAAAGKKVASSAAANWALPAAAAAAFVGWAAFFKEDGEKKKSDGKTSSAAKCEQASTPPSSPSSSPPAAAPEIPNPPPRRPDLPLYKRADVAKHSKPGDVWVTRGDGVYDVSEFVAGHPGGPSRLMLAAGGAIDPFWAMYAQHDTTQVRDILEGYRVGTLAPGEAAPPQPDFSDPYGADPPRHPAIRVVTARPFNGETPSAAAAPGSPLTPNELFYVRNHLPVPLVKPPAAAAAPSSSSSPPPTPTPAELAATVNDDWRIQVLGLGDSAEERGGGAPPPPAVLDLTVGELKARFPKVVVPATLQCSGNRRNELSRGVKPIKGLEWDSGAISTAAWGGVRLADVLEAAGVTAERAEREGKRHVLFDGADVDGGSVVAVESSSDGNAAKNESKNSPPPPSGYGASIPSRRALDRNADVILAYEMNGAPLPRDHGAPLRVIVPGVTAARSVKWLSRISLSEEEHESHYQRKDYRTFSPGTDWDTVDWEASPSIVETNVTSAIVEPCDGDVLKEGPMSAAEGNGAITVKGWAFSGGGRGIQRVDVSTDGGETWTAAQRLERVPGDGDGFALGPAWCWTHWTAEDVPLPGGFEGLGEVEIVARAVDSACNVQPEKPGPIWNLRGLVANHWAKSRITVAAAEE